jgi:hypothetical protein
MRRLLASAFLALLTLPAWSNSVNFEEQRFQNMASVNSDIALYRRDYVGLNESALRYRAPSERTPSGVPLLAFYYRGVLMYAHGHAQDADGKPIDAKWAKVIGDVTDWAAKAPSPAANIALARLYIEWGAEHRGTDLARNVDKNEWPIFFEKLEKARVVLERTKSGSSLDPEWYRAMLIISNNQDWNMKNRNALYQEALGKFPYYLENYYEISAAMEPKWGGSWQAYDAFAKFAVTKTQKQEGSSYYARLYWKTETQCGCSILDESLVRWPILKASFADLVNTQSKLR